MSDEMWHEPPNSTKKNRKFNHRSGRYAIWGQGEGERETWLVMDGQGGDTDESKAVGGPFATREEAIREAERFIERNQQSDRGTHARP